MHDVDLGLLTPEGLDSAATWLKEFMAVDGVEPSDVDGLILANVGITPEQLEEWVASETPVIVQSLLCKNQGREVPLLTLLKAVAWSAAQYSAVTVLKALQDTNEIEVS